MPGMFRKQQGGESGRGAASSEGTGGDEGKQSRGHDGGPDKNSRFGFKCDGKSLGVLSEGQG